MTVTVYFQPITFNCILTRETHSAPRNEPSTTESLGQCGGADIGSEAPAGTRSTAGMLQISPAGWREKRWVFWWDN